MKNPGFILIIVLLIIGIGSRFLFIIDGYPMLPNFTAIGAIALFGANYLKGKKRFLIPFGALWLSDLVLNNLVYKEFYSSFQIMGSLWVYASFVIIILLALVIMKKPSWLRLLFAAGVTGLVFFLITNFAVWLSISSPYPKNIAGLMECYIAGIPFFRNTVLGNAFYSLILFGVYEWAARRYVIFKSERQLSLI